MHILSFNVYILNHPTCFRKEIPIRISQEHQNARKVSSTEQSAKSKSVSRSAGDDLGCQFLNSKNQQNDSDSLESRPKISNKIKNLKKFWEENSGKSEMNNSSKPICVRPMGGERAHQISVTNQPQKEIRTKPSDVTATEKLTK